LVTHVTIYFVTINRMAKLQLEAFLPYRLNRLAAAVSQEFRSVYGPHHDLTIPEWRVLATLGQFEAMSAKAIGRHSAMHKTKVSRAVRALEERRCSGAAPARRIGVRRSWR
jgi:DNA-binding MarR family transcriptional regulator